MQLRRVLRVCAGARGVSGVGAHTSLPAASATPDFGKRRRERVAREQQQDGDDKSDDVDAATRAADEHEARHVCHERYGFLQRPRYLGAWRPFLRELRRYELSWLLTPVAGGELTLTLRDHDACEHAAVCTLRGSGTACAPVADLFEHCVHLVQLPPAQHEMSYAVPFATQSGNVTHELHLRATRRSDDDNASAATPPLGPVLARHDTTRTCVDVDVLDTRTRQRTSLLRGVSLQAFVHAFLVSVPPLLKRTDVGVRNIDLLDTAQRREFRFVWCYLRREICMTPVDMTELDLLLPP